MSKRYLLFFLTFYLQAQPPINITRYAGNGTPAAVPNSQLGDEYVDLSTSYVYKCVQANGGCSGNVALWQKFVPQLTPAGVDGDLQVKSGTNLGVGTSANVVNVFSGCSGTKYLGADGACHDAGGGGIPYPPDSGVPSVVRAAIATVVVEPQNAGADYAPGDTFEIPDGCTHGTAVGQVATVDGMGAVLTAIVDPSSTAAGCTAGNDIDTNTLTGSGHGLSVDVTVTDAAWGSTFYGIENALLYWRNGYPQSVPDSSYDPDTGTLEFDGTLVIGAMAPNGIISADPNKALYSDVNYVRNAIPLPTPAPPTSVTTHPNAGTNDTQWCYDNLPANAFGSGVASGSPVCVTGNSTLGEDGPIAVVIVYPEFGGSGYAPGDTGTVDGGTGDAAYVVDTVDGSGSVLTFHLSSAGTTYSSAKTATDYQTGSTSTVVTGGGDGSLYFLITATGHYNTVAMSPDVGSTVCHLWRTSTGGTPHDPGDLYVGYYPVVNYSAAFSTCGATVTDGGIVGNPASYANSPPTTDSSTGTLLISPAGDVTMLVTPLGYRIDNTNSVVLNSPYSMMLGDQYGGNTIINSQSGAILCLDQNTITNSPAGIIVGSGDTVNNSINAEVLGGFFETIDSSPNSIISANVRNLIQNASLAVGYNSIMGGSFNTIDGANFAFTSGNILKVTADFAYALGIGISPDGGHPLGQPLLSAVAHELCIGMNTDTCSLIIGNAGGTTGSFSPVKLPGQAAPSGQHCTLQIDDAGVITKTAVCV